MSDMPETTAVTLSDLRFICHACQGPWQVGHICSLQDQAATDGVRIVSVVSVDDWAARSARRMRLEVQDAGLEAAEKVLNRLQVDDYAGRFWFVGLARNTLGFVLGVIEASVKEERAAVQAELRELR